MTERNLLEEGLLVSRFAVARNLAAAVLNDSAPSGGGESSDLPALVEPDRRPPRLQANERAKAADKSARDADAKARDAVRLAEGALDAVEASVAVARRRAMDAREHLVAAAERVCALMAAVVGQASLVEALVPDAQGEVLAKRTVLEDTRKKATTALGDAKVAIDAFKGREPITFQPSHVDPLLSDTHTLMGAASGVGDAVRALVNALIKTARDREAGIADSKVAVIGRDRTAISELHDEMLASVLRLESATKTWREPAAVARDVRRRALMAKLVMGDCSARAAQAIEAAGRCLASATLAGADQAAGDARDAAGKTAELAAWVGGKGAQAHKDAQRAARLVRRHDALTGIEDVLPRADGLLKSEQLDLRMRCRVEIDRAALVAAAAALGGGTVTKADADAARTRMQAALTPAEPWLLVRADPQLSYSLACYLTRWRRRPFADPEVAELFDAAMTKDAFCGFIPTDPELVSAHDKPGFAVLSRRAEKTLAERKAGRKALDEAAAKETAPAK